MALHPDVQRKAQAQIDDVVGNHRLPNFDDLVSLSQIHAIVKETLRWNPVSPLGLSREITLTLNLLMCMLTQSFRPYRIGE